MTITPQNRMSIEIQFTSHGQRGRFEDRLEFVLRDSNNEVFVITRPLKAVVGNDDLRALAPTVPYRRQRRARQRTAEQTTISIEEQNMPAVGLRVKYKRRLCHENIPHDMKHILSQGSMEERVNAFRDRFIPGRLNIASFEQYWSGLVRAELIQAR